MEVLHTTGVSPGQGAALLAFAVLVLLWAYAELLAFRKRGYQRVHSDEESSPPPMEAGGPISAAEHAPAAAPDLSIANSGFIRCLRLDPEALVSSRDGLRAAVEFGIIMLWYFLADRTKVFPETTKSYSRDVMAFIFLGLTIVAWMTSMRKGKAPVLLNRSQTEEWKGWMQVLFLLYHYFEAKEVYNAIRVFIAGYVWMTGFGNFSYYYKTNDFSFGRFCQMMWRLNFLVAMTCIVLRNSYMLYYICPMHTLFTIMVYACLGLGSRFNSTHTGVFVKLALCVVVVFVCWDIKPVFYAIWGPFKFLMGYIDPRRPGDDALYEWYFRSSLDRYVWIHGMLCAYLHPWCERVLQSIESLAAKTRRFARGAMLLVAVALFYVWFEKVYRLPKLEYNKVHPYTSWIPITLWIVVRNVTPSLRMHSLGLYAWLGCITLETYISQFHTWLSTGIPDGQPKMLLAFFPAEYPLLNFAGTTAVYVFVSYRLFILTNTLKSVVVPSKTGPLMWRNFCLVVGGCGILYCSAWLILSGTGLRVKPALQDPSFRDAAAATEAFHP
ncbi:hypothetical protein WJX72_009885 [[Myrmecia] bisecta]|uniref:Cas1p 10 TM acyl transferase domain-containing protein n=1 Tax=[Myrmecia] bisecta TaxID=41462 RepID=A0AAW1PJT9_9CHLO